MHINLNMSQMKKFFNLYQKFSIDNNLQNRFLKLSVAYKATIVNY